MQLRKFYGRTLKATLARVKQELGEEALILETVTIREGSAAARMNPGARYEVCAARDEGESLRKGSNGSYATYGTPKTHTTHPKHEASRTLLRDLAELRSQIRELIDPVSPEAQLCAARLDLHDYQSLIDLGIDHRVIAPCFRDWFAWRTAPETPRPRHGIAARMQGVSLREWLWHDWTQRQGLNSNSTATASAASSAKILSLLGSTGVGKTTTLAKIASKLRHEHRQKVAILTLDTHRFGATEQWKRFSQLLDIPVFEIVNQENLMSSIETCNQCDWIGIDTPGGMTLDSEPGRLYGFLLAQMPLVQSVLMLPASQHEADSRDQMRWARRQGTDRVMFSKLDETTRPGGIVNLTMDGQWKIDSLTTGRRVPRDWEPASGQTLWNRVLAPQPKAIFEGVHQ